MWQHENSDYKMKLENLVMRHAVTLVCTVWFIHTLATTRTLEPTQMATYPVVNTDWQPTFAAAAQPSI